MYCINSLKKDKYDIKSDLFTYIKEELLLYQTTLGPGFPLRICQMCHTRLHSYKMFIEMCQKNIGHIRNYAHILQSNSDSQDQKFYDLQVRVEDNAHKININKEPVKSDLNIIEVTTHSSHEDLGEFFLKSELDIKEEFNLVDDFCIKEFKKEHEFHIKEEYNKGHDETHGDIYEENVSYPTESENQCINIDLNKYNLGQNETGGDTDKENISYESKSDNQIRSAPNLIPEYEISNNPVHHDAAISKPFSCNVCYKKFRHKRSLMYHMKIHNNPNYLQCFQCDKKFLCKNNLKTHMKIHDGIKDIRCSICNKQFRSSSNLSVHMRGHKGSKNYSCKLCDKKFTQNSNLKSHMRSHAGLKPFKCLVCDRKYSEMWYLKTHMKIHNGIKDVPCLICDSVFRTKSNLNMHVKRHHTDLKL